ncbi:MAG: TRAP transporter small permease [Gemmatimonadales bacterium]|nr:MAG: TRAP transporter small permease [Gemmatimonadales bacterium]
MRNVLGWLNRLEELTLTVSLITLAVIAFVQVCTRYLMGISVDWFEEGGRYMGVCITFLGASIGVRRGAHFSMDLLVNALPALQARILRFLVDVFSGTCFGMVAWYGFQLVMRNHRFGVTSAAIGAPMWLVYLPIPVFSVLIALRFFSSAAGRLRKEPAEGGT